MYILGIESSCDDCAIAVVEDGKKVLSSVISSQIAKHSEYGGVVPEIASRLHVETILPVAREAVDKAGVSLDDIFAIAVTAGPGLIGSLIVGVMFAKGLALSLDKPLVGVNHIHAHLYAPTMVKPLTFPYLGVLVSGGHTIIGIMHDYDKIEVLASSIDDAIGEVFDKVSKYYSLGYPGGPVVDKLAKLGDASAFNFTTPKLDSKLYRPLDLSFSGLKAAAINQRAQFLKKGKEDNRENLAASLQKKVMDVLFSSVEGALKQTGLRQIAFGGGVSANSELRRRAEELEEKGYTVAIPPLLYCTDNAVMVGGLGYQLFKKGNLADLSLAPFARTDEFKGYLRKK